MQQSKTRARPSLTACGEPGGHLCNLDLLRGDNGFGKGASLGGFAVFRGNLRQIDGIVAVRNDVAGKSGFGDLYPVDTRQEGHHVHRCLADCMRFQRRAPSWAAKTRGQPKPVTTEHAPL